MSDAKVYSQPAKGLIKETGAALQILISGGRKEGRRAPKRAESHMARVEAPGQGKSSDPQVLLLSRSGTDRDGGRRLHGTPPPYEQVLLLLPIGDRPREEGAGCKDLTGTPPVFRSGAVEEAGLTLSAARESADA